MNGGLISGLMPAFKDSLSEREVDAVLAYIKTFWTEGQRRDQASISRRYQEALDRQAQNR
jgi:mono/diheme cytochrome c family protein